MESNQQKSPISRKIARDMVREIFPRRLSPKREADFITSLIRQWTSYEGQATLLTKRAQHWFTLTRQPDGGTTVSLNSRAGNPIRGFLDDWKIDSEQVPAILRRLNVGQSAEFRNREGQRLRLWVDPQKRSTGIEILPEESDA